MEKADTEGEDSPASMMLKARVQIKKGQAEVARETLEVLLESHGNEFYYGRSVGLLTKHGFIKQSSVLVKEARKKGYDTPAFYSSMAWVSNGKSAV